jgi:hypothetical protein
MRITMSFEKIRTFGFRTISQLGYSYHASSLSKSSHRQRLSFKAGDRLPFLPGEKVHDAFRGACFHLLHIHDTPLSAEVEQSIRNVVSFPLEIVEKPKSEGWGNLGVQSELFVLVRPDNYIAHIADRFDEQELRAYLEPCFTGNNHLNSQGFPGFR